jgi:hypothetical protein
MGEESATTRGALGYSFPDSLVVDCHRTFFPIAWRTAYGSYSYRECNCSFSNLVFMGETVLAVMPKAAQFWLPIVPGPAIPRICCWRRDNGLAVKVTGRAITSSTGGLACFPPSPRNRMASTSSESGLIFETYPVAPCSEAALAYARSSYKVKRRWASGSVGLGGAQYLKSRRVASERSMSNSEYRAFRINDSLCSWRSRGRHRGITLCAAGRPRDSKATQRIWEADKRHDE